MSYLDTYGVRDARREQIIKRIILGAIAAVVVAVLLYFQFRNYGEERQIKTFLARLQAGDYKGAYALWGCTDAKPCPHYAFDKFMEDWGPASPLKNPNQASIAAFRGCHTGVLGFMRVPGQEENIQLWVDRRSQEIGFAPWRLKHVPAGLRSQMANWFWNIAQDCRPLIGP